MYLKLIFICYDVNEITHDRGDVSIRNTLTEHSPAFSSENMPWNLHHSVHGCREGEGGKREEHFVPFVHFLSLQSLVKIIERNIVI